MSKVIGSLLRRQAMVDDKEDHETSKEDNDNEECKNKEI
jgi:hypothetical protein